MLARHIQSDNKAEAQRLQSNAFEMATLLTLPAAAALAICAPAFVTAFFVGGKFKPEDGIIMAQITVALVAGLPAYVIVKILNPGFFARSDTKTPVYTALASLLVNISLNIWFIWGLGYGIVGLAAATAVSATLNCLLLYVVLHKRDWFRFTGQLGNRIFRQLIATAAMSAILWWLMDVLFDRFSGSVIDRVWSLLVLVIGGMAIYGGVGWLVGAVDKKEITTLLRRRSAAPASEG